ncbi:hypothetical protein C8R45DRAFT_946477 [Mycena sanguinolenta]|nr:hypothetical protein C8R45DRAFT_946477 [Mycena sanguinolenta]
MSSTNNQTSSHYREHTRQQDGWTVLAQPPPSADLPPPYTPEAAPPGAPGSILLHFDIPTNSNIVGAVPITRTKTYSRDVLFAIGYPEICNIMGLDSLTARLGYKWDKEKETAPMASSGTSTAKKRKAASGPASPGDRKKFDFTQEYRDLKQHLQCVTHKNELCYISPSDGHHHRVDREHASLWAKEISVGHAPSIRPPENIMFQDYFLPVAKRTRKASKESSMLSTNPCAPTIHVTVNTGTTGNSVSPSPSRRSPLATITAASASAGNLDFPSSLYNSQSHNVETNENNISDHIHYPSVKDVLKKIDDSGIFVDLPVLDFPAVIFADELEESQITRVDQVPVLDTDYYVQVVNMPVALAELFVEESIATIGRAQKGKGKGRM